MTYDIELHEELWNAQQAITTAIMAARAAGKRHEATLAELCRAHIAVSRERKRLRARLLLGIWEAEAQT